MNDPLEVPLVLAPDPGERIACLGLGGGSDAIVACLVATILEANGATEVAYGNTRARFDAPVVPISEHVGCFEGPPEPLLGRAAHGTTQIDRSLPRGPGRSPWVVRRAAGQMAHAPEQLAPQLDALGFDRIVGVDTGGDVLLRRRAARNRDRVMLRVLRATATPCDVLVVGPCSDGTAPRKLLPEIHAIAARGGYLGCLSLAPWRDRLAQLSRGLPASRTPNILLQALGARADTQQVPRGAHPRVQTALLTHVLGFSAAAISTP